MNTEFSAASWAQGGAGTGGDRLLAARAGYRGNRMQDGARGILDPYRGRSFYSALGTDPRAEPAAGAFFGKKRHIEAAGVFRAGSAQDGSDGTYPGTDPAGAAALCKAWKLPEKSRLRALFPFRIPHLPDPVQQEFFK